MYCKYCGAYIANDLDEIINHINNSCIYIEEKVVNTWLARELASARGY